MRCIPFILISFFCLVCDPGFAVEALLVKIVSIDRVKGEMTARVTGQSASDTNSAEPLTILFFPEQFPRHVEIGDAIRLWGEYLQGETKAFQAQTIRGHHGHGNDPTGVRSRLGKHRHGGMGRGRNGHQSGGHGGGHR